MVEKIWKMNKRIEAIKMKQENLFWFRGGF